VAFFAPTPEKIVFASAIFIGLSFIRVRSRGLWFSLNMRFYHIYLVAGLTLVGRGPKGEGRILVWIGLAAFVGSALAAYLAACGLLELFGRM
jgi:hypothetical protein